MHHVDRGRRRFLLAAAGAAAAAAIGPGALILLIDRMWKDDAAVAAIRALITHRADADQLGRAYLAMHRDERSSAALLRHLLGPMPPASAAETPGRIAARIRADYRAARTVTVEGWILSRTEARLCALVALT